MDALIPDYPNFVKGQVLTSQTLNGLVSYFDTQDVYTRIFLLGCGIFYGLDVSWNAQDGSLHISAGAGVSSDGELFPYYEEQVLHTYSVENVTLANTVMSLPVLKDSDGQNPLTGLFNGQTSYVILLLWDKTPVQQESCMNSYANAPVAVPVTIKAVAITVEALAVLRQQWPVVQVSQGSTSGDDPFVHRFGYQADATGANGGAAYISFDNFTSWDAVKANFMQVCTEGIPTIAKAYQAAYQSLYAVLQLPAANPFDALADTLKELLEKTNAGNNDTALPYYYDYLRNLVAAYQELAATEAYRAAAVMPDPDRFPGYIALGGINGQAADDRMGLYRPPLADLDTSSLDLPAALLQRMIAMADLSNTLFSNWTNLETTYITPDRGLAKSLGKRAIPFYFTNRDSKLLPLWNPAISLQNRTFTIPGITPGKDREFLLRDIDAYLFFRIQGHVGLDVQTALSTLQGLRRSLHLPFDIRVVYLGTEDDLQQLISQQIGLFQDIDLWLEKIVADIRCNNTCGTGYEDAIFNGASRNMDYAGMLQALDSFFNGVTETSFAGWSRERCAKLCPNGNVSCCAETLHLLWDLYQEYQRRKAALLPELLFHRFAASHPGLEHCAGVPKGGTLVLVANPAAAPVITIALRNRVADTLNRLQNLSDTDRARVLSNLQDAGSYTVVADFCLPYTCCSKTPSVEVVFRQPAPVAAFEEQARNTTEGGYTLVLQNNSQNASSYQWQLQDSNGNVLDNRTTSSLTETASFDLLFKNGVRYTVRLTATDGVLSDSTQQDFNICPASNSIQLNMDGKDEYEWTQGNDAPPLRLTASPQGGTFNLTTQDGRQLKVDDYVKWNDDQQSITFDYSKLEVNVYELNYSFSACDVGISFTLTVDQQVEVPQATATAIKAMYNKRAQQFRQTVAQAGDADKNLARMDKFGQTTAFLRFTGKSAEMDKRYSDLLASLSTRLGSAAPQRQQQVLQLLGQATAYYVDRQLIDAPDAVPDNAKPLLQQAAGIIKENGGAPDTLVAAWNPDALQTGAAPELVQTYKNLLTA